MIYLVLQVISADGTWLSLHQTKLCIFIDILFYLINYQTDPYLFSKKENDNSSIEENMLSLEVEELPKNLSTPFQGSKKFYVPVGFLSVLLDSQAGS